MTDYIKRTQEQATAAWINSLNQQRINELLYTLNNQDFALEQTLAELQKLKKFIGDPSHILGNTETKHGEIAENVQVYISNARRFIKGEAKEYTFEGVGRTAPEDYLKNGFQVQSKFRKGLKETLIGTRGVLHHLREYPDFVKNGGSYDIPKDQYDEMISLLNLRESNPTILRKQDWRLLHVIDSFEEESGLNVRKDINPSVATYSEVQQGAIYRTLKNEENSLLQTDQDLRNEAYYHSQPSLKEGIKVTAVSSILEGGVAFCSSVAQKRKSGKHLAEFTTEDWKEVGIDTGSNTIKGGIRGATVYALSNFTATPANIATGLVTATFGVILQAKLLHEGKVSNEEFLINSEALCLDVSLSTVSSLLGEIVIPVPILGAIVGNVVGMVLYDIAKSQGLEYEQSLIAGYRSDIVILSARYEAQYQALLELLDSNFKKFNSMIKLAFDEDVNTAFISATEFARFNGVPEDKILKTIADVDEFFLG